MFCKNCGHEIDDKAVICVGCGQSIAQPKPPVASGWVILLLIVFFPVGLYLMWAKTNWSKAAKIIITVVIALICIGSLGGGDTDDAPGSGSSPSYSQTQDNAPSKEATASTKETTPVDPYADAIVITAEDLFAAYDENEVAADNQYKGKLLKVTGVINDIGKDILDDTYITLDTGEFIFSVQCYFKGDDADALAALTKGQTVTLVGKCDGMSMNVVMKKCEIIG